MAPRYLTRSQAAEYLGVSPATLATYATRGGGPPFHKPDGHSLVRYFVPDLDAWMGRPRRNTGDTD